MRKQFDDYLRELDRRLLNMAASVEHIIAMSAKSIEDQNEALAAQAIAYDSKINEDEKDIERICLKCLLKHQPVVADDLRRVSAALKMISDMERIGDAAADIAQLNKELIKQNARFDLSDISEMARLSAKMVADSIDAYVKNDLQLAQDVVSEDEAVDGLFSGVKKKIIDGIADDRANGEKLADTLMTAKYFEKIGDHAVNIAEWVIFSISGVHKQAKIM